MEILDSTVDPQSNQFRENERHNRALTAELHARMATVRSGGGEKAQQRHTEQGKFFVRERIDRLLDAGSPFLELSPLAAWDLYAGDAPAAGIVTRIGRIAGRECPLVANDPTGKAGSWAATFTAKRSIARWRKRWR